MQLQSSFNMAQGILIKNSIFSNNTAGKGGALGVNGNFLGLNATIENNFFYNNVAPGKKTQLITIIFFRGGLYTFTDLFNEIRDEN